MVNAISKVIGIAILGAILIGFFGFFVWAGREVIPDAGWGPSACVAGIAAVACAFACVWGIGVVVQGP